MDFIFIDDMRVEAHVGIFEREKAAPQTLEISLTFGVPDDAAQNDDIDRTIRYDAVIDRIRVELAARHFNLLETLGEYVIGLLLNGPLSDRQRGRLVDALAATRRLTEADLALAELVRRWAPTGSPIAKVAR